MIQTQINNLLSPGDRQSAVIRASRPWIDIFCIIRMQNYQHDWHLCATDICQDYEA
jgi:hypothetical protein